MSTNPITDKARYHDPTCCGHKGRDNYSIARQRQSGWTYVLCVCVCLCVCVRVLCVCMFVCMRTCFVCVCVHAVCVRERTHGALNVEGIRLLILHLDQGNLFHLLYFQGNYALVNATEM